MARFLDHHPLPNMSLEQMNEMTAKLRAIIQSQKADQFGVTVLNVFMADGQSWGYTDAPNSEAVVKNHEAMGVKISVKDVIPVTPVV
jgi:hypothetical protein